MGTQSKTDTSTAVKADVALTEHHQNLALISGALASAPETKRLPSGSDATNFSLTVREPGQKTTSVPIVWFDPPARVGRWSEGDQVTVVGSVVRRFYRAGNGLGSRTEVVVSGGHLATHRAKHRSLVERATQRLADWFATVEPPSH